MSTIISACEVDHGPSMLRPLSAKPERCVTTIGFRNFVLRLYFSGLVGDGLKRQAG